MIGYPYNGLILIGYPYNGLILWLDILTMD